MGNEPGWTIHVQWPTVCHASAYVVEILEHQSGLSQRFVRVASPDVMASLTELRIDGLQPGAYAACVRCVAPCGCESIPSPWATLHVASSPPCGMHPPASALIMQPPPSAPAPITT